ncbi:hypothetical protein V6N13_094104 [Hibiscus sabdariffa]
MGMTMKRAALIVAGLGLLSFIFGVVAENNKPAAGTLVSGKGVVVCRYPRDPSVPLGYLSVSFLILSCFAGYTSLFYPYKGRSVPQSVLFQSTAFFVFFNIALFTGGLAAALLLWPTITEHLHLTRNVHHNLATTCPTAKTGLLGGGAFVSLDSALFWLVALMLADNARQDHFDEVENGSKAEALAKGDCNSGDGGSSDAGRPKEYADGFDPACDGGSRGLLMVVVIPEL